MRTKLSAALVAIAAALSVFPATAQVEVNFERPQTYEVREGAARKPAPAIPLATIAPFLSRPYVLEKSQIDRAPYVVDFPEGHIVGGLNDAVYVRSIFAPAGQRYEIVRPGEPYRDPDTGEILGYAALFIAGAILERPGDPAKVRIADVAQETGIGDRLIAAVRDEPMAAFTLHPAPRDTKARIISVLNGVSQIGQYNVVVLDRGSREGLRPGQVMEVYNGGEETRDTVRSGTWDWGWEDQKFWSQETWYGEYRVQGWHYGEPDSNAPLPPYVEVRRPSDTFIQPYERAGTLMVFRTFPRVSFALILRAERPIHLLDAARPPAD